MNFPIFGASKKQEEKAPLYFIQDGRMTFNTHQLNSAQCEVAATTCQTEARYQYLQAFAKGAGTVLAAAAIIVVAFVLAKVAAPFFAFYVGKLAVLAELELPEITPFIVKVATKGVIYLGGAFALKKLWDTAHSTVQNHLNYAADLDRQALNALLHRAGQMVLIPIRQ